MIDILAVQGELYKVLSSTGYNVFDTVPDETEYPFISIGYSQLLDSGTKTNIGYEIMQNIDIFSNYTGQKEIKEISQKVIQTINDNDIKINNLYLDIKLNNMVIQKEDDKSQSVEGSTKGSIYHSSLILKIKTIELNK